MKINETREKYGKFVSGIITSETKQRELRKKHRDSSSIVNLIRFL